MDGKHAIQVKRKFLKRIFDEAVECKNFVCHYEKVIPQQTLAISKIWEHSKETFTMDSVFSVVIGGRLDSPKLLKKNYRKTFFREFSETFNTLFILNIPQKCMWLSFRNV